VHPPEELFLATRRAKWEYMPTNRQENARSPEEERKEQPMSSDRTIPDRRSAQAAIEEFDAAGIEAVERAVLTRRSVRGFLPDPVPLPLLERIFALAQSTPSNCNVQPWRAYVASGAVRDRIQAALARAVVEGVPGNPDFERGAKFAGVYRELQVECAMALYEEMNISRDDRAGRARASLRNYELFDAPHVAFIGMSKDFGTTVALDVGMYVQTLMLLMTAHGIASCPMGSLRHYPDLVRDELDVPGDIGILCGICFGYEDAAVLANRTRTTRARVSDNVRFQE
jgi:nitroreductase